MLYWRLISTKITRIVANKANNISLGRAMKTATDLWENHHLYSWKKEICPSMASDVSGLSWWLVNNSMGMRKRSDMYSTEMVMWESMRLRLLRPRITTISESMSLTEWLKKGSPGVLGQNEIESSTWRVSHNWGWSCESVGIYNLNRKGNIPQYDIKCVTGQKIRWHQIIHHQMHGPSHPRP